MNCSHPFLLVLCVSLTAGPQTGDLAEIAQLRPTPLIAPSDTIALHVSIEHVMDEWRVPGLAVAVRYGDVEWTRGYGVQDVDQRDPVTAHTRFAIGSTSKQFTAAAVMMLVEDGKLSLDDGLSVFFPGLPSAYRDITIHQLLVHESGVGRDFKARGHSVYGSRLLELLKATPLDFSPGDSWNYSNTGFILLGMIVEQISEQSFNEFLAQRILRPLGMDSTVLIMPQANGIKRATGYEGGKNRLSPLRFLPARYGAGNVVSTAHDMALWAKGFVSDEVVATSSRRLMWRDLEHDATSSLVDGSGRPFTTGYGWWVTRDADWTVARHGGSVDGFLSTLDYYPAHDLTVIVLLNNEGSLGAQSQIVQLIRDYYLQSSQAQSQSSPRFTRITADTVANEYASTGGVSWIDFDGDGDHDLFVTNGYDVSAEVAVPQANRLYENRSGRFVALDTRLTTDSGFSSGNAWADFDNDGDLDVFVSNQRNQDNFLYRNEGHAVFAPVPGAITHDGGLSFSGTWADVDHDGLVDLLVSNGGLSGTQNNFLYMNTGSGFERQPNNLLERDSLQTGGATFVDVDLDGDADLFLSGRRRNVLYRNDGRGNFSELTGQPLVTDGPLLSGSVGAAWGDYDNDGDFDVYVGYMLGESDRLYRNDGNMHFTLMPEVAPARDGAYSVQPLWADIDNDADLDLVVVPWGSPTMVYLNDGRGNLERAVLGDLGQEMSFGSSAAVADMDGDGDLDLLVGHWPNNPGEGERNLLYRNDGPVGNWLGLDLVGTESNRSAIGARVVVRAVIAGRTVNQTREVRSQQGWRSQNAFTVHVGLGDARSVSEVAVYWPSGHIDRLHDVQVNSRLRIVEGS